MLRIKRLKHLAIATGMLTIVGLASAGDGATSGASAISSPTAVAEMEARLGTLDKEILAERKELETIAPRRQLLSVRARQRGRYLYRLTRAGLLPLGGGFHAFVEHAQRVESLKRSIGADNAEATRLATRSIALAASLDKLEKERTDLAERKQLVEAAKVAIDEEKRRSESFERAFATSTGGGGGASGGATVERATSDIVVYGPTGKTSPGEDSGAFRTRKGRLTFPIAGQAEVKATTREGGPGVEIKAAAGAPVRAVHPGRVAFADRYGTYGKLVIIDHGEKYYTVSGNLASIDVKVGDQLSAGEKIGSAGGEPGGPASLYFEIRLGSERLPPTAWLGL
jgi:septal ring factor EnvC (AmiA/AmiB activator)